MTAVRVWATRVLGALGLRRPEHDLVDEIETHLSLLAEEYETRGLSPAEARLAARRAFGGVDQVRRRWRDQHGLPVAEVLVQDLRAAVRGLVRQPGFSLGAVVTFALAIGFATAVYSLVYGVLLRPLPYPDDDGLVRIWEEHPGATAIGGNRWLSQHTEEPWSADRRTLTAFGGYTSSSGILRHGETRVALAGASMTASLVDMLGLTSTEGRWFVDEDAAPGAPGVLVLSHAVWLERFGGRPDVVGTSVFLDDEPRRIVGVAHPSIRFPSERTQFWLPYAVPRVAADPARTSGFNALGRLAPGRSITDVEVEGTRAARSVTRPMSAELVFGKGGPVAVRARSLRDDMAASVRPALVALAVAVVLILAVACANVGSLLLARGVARQREFAIRAAVGASRGRLVFQTLAESGLLALAGGVAGVALAWALVRAFPAVAPQGFPRVAEVALDWPVLTAATLATLAAALLAGIVPAVRNTDGHTAETMRGGDGGTGEAFRGRRARRWRDGLLVVESAMAVVLLVGALLFGHSLSRLMQVDPGYTADRVALAQVSLPRGTTPERAATVVDGLLEALRAHPAVASAGAASSMPMVPMTGISSFPIEPAPGAEPVMTRSLTYTVSPGYAETLGLRLLDGRFFTTGDQRPGVRAVMVNAEFARRYLQGRAVGRRFPRLYGDEGDVPTEIVGVVGTVLKDGHDRAVEPEIYFAHGSPTRALSGYFTVSVRAAGDLAEALVAMRDTVTRVDPTAVVERADLLADRVYSSMAQPRFATLVTAAFALVGVVVASAGLLAVLSYAVAQRRRELSVRAALGAGRVALVALILREGLFITGLGIALGLVTAAGLTGALRSLLFQVSPLDPLSFALAVAVLLPVAAAACLVPAWRAASADPAGTLRGE